MARQPRKVASARAYYRLARKADIAGQTRTADRYRDKADRLMDSHHREQARKVEREANEKAWRESRRAQ